MKIIHSNTANLITLDLLHLATKLSVKPENCNWFYKILGENQETKSYYFEEDEGFFAPCPCVECKGIGTDLNEYISIFGALCRIKEIASHTPVWLWIDSEKFSIESEKKLFGLNAEKYTCPSLKLLYKGLESLFIELNIRVCYFEDESIINYCSH